MKAALRTMRAFPSLRLDELLSSSRLLTLAGDVLAEEYEARLAAQEEAERRAAFAAEAAAFRATKGID